nr:MAG TPA: hypothetical protein [Caudoviricetes sp.]
MENILHPYFLSGFLIFIVIHYFCDKNKTSLTQDIYSLGEWRLL